MEFTDRAGAVNSIIRKQWSNQLGAMGIGECNIGARQFDGFGFGHESLSWEPPRRGFVLNDDIDIFTLPDSDVYAP